MSRSLKPKNNEYIDSTGIAHNRRKLSDILQEMKDVENYTSQISPLINVELNANDQQLIKNNNGLVVANLTFKAKTAVDLSQNTAIFQMPAAVRPKGNVLFTVWSYSKQKYGVGFFQITSSNVLVNLGETLNANEEINMMSSYYI